MNLRRPVIIGIVAGIACFGAFLSYYSLRFGLNVPPSTSGDETSYDGMAWEVSQGRGFRLDVSNAEFRRPYDIAAETDPERFHLTPDEAFTVTNRPPLYPLLLAGTNTVFGRQFWAARVMDALAMAIVCGATVWYVCCRVGFSAGAIAAFLFIAVDVRTRLYGRAILTEALAAFLVMGLCLSLLVFRERLKSFSEPAKAIAMPSAIIGVFLGLLVLCRNVFVVWLLLIWLMIWWLCRQRVRFAKTISTITVAVSLLIATPWAIRNCRVTGEFMPTGTQGLMQSSAAYSDQAWELRGIWKLLPSDFFDDVPPQGSRIADTVAKAKHSKERAITWIRSNPGKALALAPLKVWQEFRPRNWSEAILLALAVLGGVVYWRDADGRILWAIVGCNTLAIAGTWSVEGRFLVPLLFIQHVFAATGGWWLIQRTPGPLLLRNDDEDCAGAVATSKPAFH